jgi:hypothetical protein
MAEFKAFVFYVAVFYYAAKEWAGIGAYQLADRKEVQS